MNLPKAEVTDQLPGGAIGWQTVAGMAARLNVSSSRVSRLVEAGRLEGAFLGEKMLVRMPASFELRRQKNSVGEESGIFISCPHDGARMNSAVCQMLSHFVSKSPFKLECNSCQAWRVAI